jgi:hypothetical protein
MPIFEGYLGETNQLGKNSDLCKQKGAYLRSSRLPELLEVYGHWRF